MVCLRQNFTVAQVGLKSYYVAEDDLNFRSSWLCLPIAGIFELLSS